MNKIDSIQFSDDDILKALRNHNTNKGHGHDDVIIRIIKLCVSYVMNYSQLYLNIVSILMNFQTYGRNQMDHLL